MDDAAKRDWDGAIGVFGPMLTVVGILVGVSQFNTGEKDRARSEQAARLHQVRLEMRKDDLEYRRLLRQQQLQAYSNTASPPGQSAAEAAGPARVKDVQSFEAAYWGTMVMVEDPGVAQAM